MDYDEIATEIIEELDDMARKFDIHENGFPMYNHEYFEMKLRIIDIIKKGVTNGKSRDGK